MEKTKITRLFALLLFALSLTQPAMAGPKKYEGTLSGRNVTVVLDWLDEKNVAGFLVDNAKQQLLISGSNSAQGVIEIKLSDGGNLIASGTLRKTIVNSSIVWSGLVNFSEGSGLFTFQRRSDSPDSGSTQQNSNRSTAQAAAQAPQIVNQSQGPSSNTQTSAAPKKCWLCEGRGYVKTRGVGEIIRKECNDCGGSGIEGD